MRSRLPLLLLWCCALSTRASADDGVDRPRVTLGGGFSVDTGAEAEVGGRSVEGDTPATLAPLSPQAFARFEVPLRAWLVLGSQVGVAMWTTDLEERLGFKTHGTFDLSLLPKVRWTTGRRLLSEVFAALPFGPSLDYLGASEGGPASHSARGGIGGGWHAGLVAGYQATFRGKLPGAVVEAGFTYHQVSQDISYAGSTQRDSVLYRPVAIFLRAGLVLSL